MTATETLSVTVHEWLSLPLQAMQSPLSALVMFAFGMIHVLLPGHGKMLLAARHLAAGSTRASISVLDAFTFAGARALVAFALVMGTIYASNAFGIAVPLRAMRIVAGAALAGIGLHLLLHTFTRHKPVAESSGSGFQPLAKRQLNRSVALLAITPEPVALAIASFGVAQFNIAASGLSILALALGMGTTLSLTTLFAGKRTRYAPKIIAWSGLLIGLILAATGTLVITDAL